MRKRKIILAHDVTYLNLLFPFYPVSQLTNFTLNFSKMKVFLFLILAWLCSVEAFNYMDYSNLYNGEVHLHVSKISGRLSWESSDSEWKAWEFLGMKYATAERFQAPKNFDDYDHKQFRGKNGQRKPFDTYGPMCSQNRNASGAATTQGNMSEDCLYLNIHLPGVNKDHPLLRRESWPVMLYIHGGDFKEGAGHHLNASILARQMEAVVITVNYRLGPFGFFGLDNFHAPGNWGLKDIKMSLKWIQMFIDRFGADPTRIVLCGQDSGALLASLLLTDREVTRIVSGAILLGTSGTSFPNQHTIRPYGLPKSLSLARSLNCSVNSSEELLKCFRAKSDSEIIAADEQNSDESVYWSPSLELDVVLDEPQRIFRSSSFEGNILRGMSMLNLLPDANKGKLELQKSDENTTVAFYGWTKDMSDLLDCQLTDTHRDVVVSHLIDLNGSVQVNDTKENIAQGVEHLLGRLRILSEADHYASRVSDSQKHGNYQVFGIDIDLSNCGYEAGSGYVGSESAVLSGLWTTNHHWSEQSPCQKVERQLQNMIANFLTNGNDVERSFDVNHPKIFRLRKDFRWSVVADKKLGETRILLDQLRQISCAT